MDTPAETPRPKAGIWPLAAMALLVGMLTTFLVLIWMRRDDDKPAATPVHTVDKVATAPDKTTPPDKPDKTDPDKPDKTDVTPQQDPKDKEAAAKIEAARKALADGNLEAARQAVAEARKIKDVDELKAVEEGIRVAAARREQEEKARIKRERDAHAAKATEEAEGLYKDNRYVAAEKRLLDEIARDPEMKTHPDIERMMAKIVELAKEAHDKVWAPKVDEARKLAEDGRYGQALITLRQARLFFPEEPANEKVWDDVIERMRTAHMARIPGGMQYKLGTPGRKDEPERDYKGPGFLIDLYEVTNEDYHAFLIATGHRAPQSKTWSRDPVTKAPMPFPEHVRHPVTGITAADAETFAKWLGKRLPTEDEWEYAARAIDGRTWPWGSQAPEVKDARCLSKEYLTVTQPRDIRFLTLPVGSLPNGASPYGVFDLSGNVAEWTATEEMLGDRKGRVIKGGSFVMPVEACRPAARLIDDPALPYAEVGFRLVRDLEK
jgi:formylglycine-generating enzyme required for sulfatase activity